MAAYLEKAKKLMGTFPTASVKVIPWSKNANVDALAKLALTKDTELLDTLSIEFLVQPKIKKQPEVMELVQEPSCMDPTVAYLENNKVPKGKT